MLYDNSMGSLLEIQNLQIRFGMVEAVRGASLSIDEGEVLGVVGESGSGKSATALATHGTTGSVRSGQRKNPLARRRSSFATRAQVEA